MAQRLTEYSLLMPYTYARRRLNQAMSVLIVLQTETAMTPSVPQLIIVAILFLLLFGGRGKISAIMGDVAKGITSFRKGLKEEPASDPADEALDVTPKDKAK